MIQDTTRDIQTHVSYLSRLDRYESEKPFSAAFPVDDFEGGEYSNHVLDKQAVTVQDARKGDPPTLDTNGFCYIKAQTDLTYLDLENDQASALERYLPQLERILYKRFPEYSRIDALETEIRERAPEFPHGAGTQVKHQQPAALAHSDFTIRGAFLELEQKCPGQEEFYKDRSFDMINVWRVLRGPNDDWPLGLCDFQSIDMENDLAPNDLLRETRVCENCLLRPNENHRWYYLSQQEEDDLIVFRNADSEGRRACAFHAAFFNPEADCLPRQSIEVRLIAFR